MQNRSQANLAKYARIEAFAGEHDVDFYPAGRGIGHQIMIEEGYAFPGVMTVASDSGVGAGRSRCWKAAPAPRAFLPLFFNSSSLATTAAERTLLRCWAAAAVEPGATNSVGSVSSSLVL